MLADWVLANGIGSRYTKLNAGRMTAEERDAQDRAFFARPDMIFGGTDAGAHLKMFCGAGSALYLLTHWVRDTGELTVEQAVHFLTQRSTDFFSLRDRGVLEVGRRGDVNVFALDEIELHDLERVHRPAGWRLPLLPSVGRVPRHPRGRRAHCARRQAHRGAPRPPEQRPHRSDCVMLSGER